MHCRLLLVSLLLWLVPDHALGAGATSLDDFEFGPLPAVTNPGPGAVVYTQTGLPTQSCFTGERKITVQNLATVEVTGGEIDDTFFASLPVDDGEWVFFADVEYLFDSPTDLTFGGEHDRFRIHCEDVQWDMWCVVELYVPGDAPEQPSGQALFQLPPNDYHEVLFTYLGTSLFNLRNAERLRFRFIKWPGASGSLRIGQITLASAIVLTAENSAPSSSLPFEDWIGVPYDDLWSWTDDGGGSGSANLEINFDAAHAAGGEVYPGVLDAEDSGPGEEPGRNFGMVATLSTPVAQPGNFGFTSRVVPPVGTAELVEAPMVLTSEPGLVIVEAVSALTAAGAIDPHDLLRHRIAIQIPGPAPVAFGDVMVDGPAGSDAFAIGFDLVDVMAAAELPRRLAVGDELFRVEISAERIAPDISTAADAALPFTDLRAVPAVTGGRTTLSFQAPRPHDTDLEVYDSRGRLVTRLPLPAGSSSAIWNGVDSRGARVASGVYWVRDSGSPGPGARVTVLR